MVRPRITERKPTLNVSISPYLYRQLKKEIGNRKVSGFVEKAIVKELSGQHKKLKQEQKELERKLIADYQKESSRAPNKEDKMWEEAGIEDIANE